MVHVKQLSFQMMIYRIWTYTDQEPCFYLYIPLIDWNLFCRNWEIDEPYMYAR